MGDGEGFGEAEGVGWRVKSALEEILLDSVPANLSRRFWSTIDNMDLPHIKVVLYQEKGVPKKHGRPQM